MQRDVSQVLTELIDQIRKMGKAADQAAPQESETEKDS
jgi:hypothetical protein